MMSTAIHPLQAAIETLHEALLGVQWDTIAELGMKGLKALFSGLVFTVKWTAKAIVFVMKGLAKLMAGCYNCVTD